MSRQLKFRVWDADNKKFLFEKELFIGGRARFTLNLKGELDYIKDSFDGQKDPDYKFQQFAGLTDKNGKEIYEGDILKWTHPMDDIGVCEYLATDAFAPLYPDQCYFGLVVSRLGICHFQADDDYEVIGNVFENPELLK